MALLLPRQIILGSVCPIKSYESFRDTNETELREKEEDFMPDRRTLHCCDTLSS